MATPFPPISLGEIPLIILHGESTNYRAPAGSGIIRFMSSLNILLADDHAVVRAGIRKVVEELADVQVIAEVGDGSELFAALEQFQPDCLLIDVTMPDFEPIVAIRRIRQQYPQLKILVVSAYDDDVYVQGLLGAGVNGYHLKDQPLRDLKLAVERVLAGERWISGPLIARLVNPGRNSQPSGLTLRQQELLRFLCEGKDNQRIAQLTGLSVKTVENHLTRIYRHLKVQSRGEAVNTALQHPDILGNLAGDISIVVKSSADSSSQPVTVLVVDDNVRFRQQLHRVISNIYPSATVHEAGDVTAAIRAAQRLLPDLALVDVVLKEGEDGLRCTRRIKVASPATRVILISAYPDREFHRLGLEAGAVAFVDKKDLDALTLKQIIGDLSA